MQAYAVVEAGGKQYRVRVNDKLRIERVAVEPGKTIELAPVLAVSDGTKLQVGKPSLEAKVSATVVEHIRGPKVRSFKRKRRKGFHKHIGHRQELTVVKIEAIQ
jgi:large subunit ribosomal protein L21